MIGTSLVPARLFMRNDGGTALGFGVLPGPTGTKNGHLLWKVQVTHMPEPSAVALLCVGLATLGTALRRRL